MMGRLKPISAKKLIKKLQALGFVETHRRGSHFYFKKDNKIVTVPVHGNKDIPIGTLHNIIIHQAGLSVDYFNRLTPK